MKKSNVVKTLISIIVIGCGIGYFMYQAMQSSWSYYYSVDDFTVKSDAVKSHSLRIAGMVKQGSVNRNLEKMDLTFTLTGSKNEIPVSYKGSVPDNFTEDGEVVVEGFLDTSGLFQANMLLTRCESKYKAKLKVN